MNPRLLSRELRKGRGGYLGYRRRIALSSVFSLGCMALISLYQIGVIRHIPEPPVPGLDADKVDASGEAYRQLQVGDAFIGMASYAVTAGLAGMGGARRAERNPLLPLALAGKAGFDLLQAGRLTYSQFARQGAVCFWCLAAAAATLATALSAVPEAKAAFGAVRRRRP